MVGRIQADMSPYHPVPSVSTESPYYNSGCKWYGPTWPPDVVQTVKGLIAGTEKYTDPQYVAVWDQLARWAPYLSDGYQAQRSYSVASAPEASRSK